MNPRATLILNVDDNEGARYAKSRVLTHAGFDVIEAASGQEALDAVRDHHPALVLLDVKLPDISGIEVCERIKADPLIESTLVLQTSAAAVGTLDRVRALDGGADSYLTEPIEPIELVANVRALLRLRQAEDALREADRRKNLFLATLAHELRNPLAPIRNAVELMEPKYAASADMLGESRAIVGRQLAHLSRLVDDLLDVSRITHGKIALRVETVNIASAVATAIEASRPSIERKRHTLTVNVPDPAPRVTGDSVRIAQIVSNLLSNAARYTPDGGQIALDVETHDGMVSIRVRDNGMGILADELPEVFTLFMQSRDVIARSEGGLGLGLSLVRALTDMHGGSVDAYSDGPGQGAEFIVRLPAQAADTPPRDEPLARGAASAVRAEPFRVLIADDNVDGASAMAALLESLGHAVHVEHDGRAAIAAARTFGAQAAVLDIGLPGCDGYEVAKTLRAQSDTAHMLLLALTGYGQEADRARAHEAGFDHHFVKPAPFAEIVGAIERGMTARRVQAGDPVQASQPQGDQHGAQA